MKLNAAGALHFMTDQESSDLLYDELYMEQVCDGLSIEQPEPENENEPE